MVTAGMTYNGTQYGPAAVVVVYFPVDVCIGPVLIPLKAVVLIDPVGLQPVVV